MILEGTHKDNVFDKNPGVEFFDISRELILKYGREKASKVFWSLYFIYHPESKIFNMGMNDKIRNVGKDYLNVEEEEARSIIIPYGKNFIQEFVNDPVAKLFSLVKKKLDEYFDVIAFLDFNINIDEKGIKQIDSLKDLSGYQKAVEDYEAAKKKYVEKRETGKLYGNTIESVRELRYRLGKKR